MTSLSLWPECLSCLSCLSCEASLPYSVWFGALSSHIFLYNCVLNMLFLCSALQLASHCLTQRMSPAFQRQRWGGTTLSVTFTPLSSSSSFTCSTTRHVLLLPAFPSSVLLPRFPTHHLLSFAVNDLIPLMPLHLSWYVWSKLPAALILAGVTMSWLAALLCDSGKLVIFWMYNARKITLILVSFMKYPKKFDLIATLRPSCNFNIRGENDHSWPSVVLWCFQLLQGNTAH